MTQIIKPLTREGAQRISNQVREKLDGIAADSVDVADLLRSAKDGKAWQALGYDSWKDYIETEFSMSKRHANQLLVEDSIRKCLSDSVGREIISHPEKTLKGAVIREIAKLPPEKRAEAVATATKAGKVTAKSVKAVVDQIQPPSRSDGLAELAAAAEDAERENERLRRLNESLTATDTGAAIVKLNGKYEAVNGRVNQLLETESKMRSEIKYRDGILDKVRKLLKVESNAKIVPALEALIKEACAC